VPILLEDGREITATLLRIFHDKEGPNGARLRARALNLYWYVGSDGTTCPEHYEHILLTYFDSIFRNIQHRWSMASIYIPLAEQIVGQEDPLIELGALEDARAFVSKLAPTFMTKR
jgi:hypothetical protein